MLNAIDPELFGHIYYEKQYPSLYDSALIKQDSGFEAGISLRQGLTLLLDWYEREQFGSDAEKDRFEDRLAQFYETSINGIRF